MNTLIYIDVPIALSDVPSDFDGRELVVAQTAEAEMGGTLRRYYASADPLVLIRCDGFDLQDALAAKYADASIGYDAGTKGYVLPQNIGLRHTKLTLRSLMTKQFSINTRLVTLSSVIASAPSAPVDTSAADALAWARDALAAHAARIARAPTEADIALLARAARGEPLSAEETGAARRCLDDLMTIFGLPPGGERGGNAALSPGFWSSPLGHLMARAASQLHTLITVSEAARLLNYDTGPRGLMRVRGLIERGALRAWPDFGEPNPRKATRVEREQVLALAKKLNS